MVGLPFLRFPKGRRERLSYVWLEWQRSSRHTATIDCSLNPDMSFMDVGAGFDWVPGERMSLPGAGGDESMKLQSSCCRGPNGRDGPQAAAQSLIHTYTAWRPSHLDFGFQIGQFLIIPANTW